jgi:hypothetical protein
LFGNYYQGVVDDDVEDFSTVSLIQLEEKTVDKRGILALDTQKGSGPNDISTGSEKDCAGSKKQLV